MKVKSDPLAVLIEIKNQLNLDVDDSLIEKCYALQQEHQYNKDRNVIPKMEALIETVVVNKNGDVLL